MSDNQSRGRSRAAGRKKTLSNAWRIAGIITSVILAAVGILFTAKLMGLGVLPSKYQTPVLTAVWILIVLLAVLQFVRPMRIVSKILAVLFVLVLAVGTYMLGTVQSLLNETADVTVSVDTVQVYVMDDDPAELINDTAEYQYGILMELDRENTDAAQAEIEAELGVTLSVTEYVSMLELAQALLDGEVQAILVNSAYISIVDEDENLADFPELIRVLASYDIERELEISEGVGTDEDNESEESYAAEETVTIDADNMSSFVVYISGNDATGTLNSTGRSDVNILMAVNPTTHTILLVNTPRDYYVQLAGIGAYDKLTHASIYGVDVSMKTLGNLYGVSVQYYARMNFTGFVEIIDALGGVTVVSEVAFETGEYSFVVGENVLDGEAALAFARERYAFSSGDRQRGINQMAVIKAVINKLASPAILSGYSDIMAAASGSFGTNLTQDEIAELVKYQLSYGGSWTIETISADGSDSTSTVYSAQSTSLYVMIPYESSVAEVSAKLASVLAGE